jgi:hypothetical protein
MKRRVPILTMFCAAMVAVQGLRGYDHSNKCQ